MAASLLKRWYWTARWRAGRLAMHVGNAIGSERLIYNRITYEHYAYYNRESAPAFVAAVQRTWPSVRSVVDLGCGTGEYVRAFRAAGLGAEGYEWARIARQIAQERYGIALHPLNLSADEAIPVADLAMSIEVAEHLRPELGDRLVSLLCRTAPLVLFTAAPPGQGGAGHINEQPPEYWLTRFAAHGFTPDKMGDELRRLLKADERVLNWVVRNLLVLSRG